MESIVLKNCRYCGKRVKGKGYEPHYERKDGKIIIQPYCNRHCKVRY